MADRGGAGNARDALATKKLRVQWREVPDAVDREALIESVFTAICERQPTRPGGSQDEYVDLLEVVVADDGVHVRADYLFDWDYASAIDRTESHELELVIGLSGTRVTRWV